QRDRVGLLHRGDGLPQREAMASGRSDRALGRFRPAGGRTPVPQGPRLSGNSVAVEFAGKRGGEEAGCERSRGCVAYEGLKVATFNGVPDNLKIVLVGFKNQLKKASLL